MTRNPVWPILSLSVLHLQRHYDALPYSTLAVLFSTNLPGNEKKKMGQSRKTENKEKPINQHH